MNLKKKNNPGKIKKIGRYPVNSRIDVDYSGDKPKIKFSYPEKGPEQIYNSDVVMLVSLFLTIFIIMIGYSLVLPTQVHPENCTFVNDVFTSNWTNDTFFFGAKANCSFKNENISFDIDIKRDITSINGIRTTAYREYEGDKSDIERAITSPSMIVAIGGLILYLILIKLVALFFYKTKFGNSKFPVINKVVHNRNWMARFNPKKVQYDSINKYWYCEIPLFANIFLDYVASGEMSDKLIRVKIEEHPFDKLKRIRMRKRGKKERYKKSKNISLWRARFIFKSKPQKGYIEVGWK